MRRKTNVTRETLFPWTSRHALCQPKLERQNPANLFSDKENLFPARTRFHMRRKLTCREERSSPRRTFLNPLHAPSMPTKLRGKSPPKLLRLGKNRLSAPKAPQNHLHPTSVPLLHPVPQHDPTRNMDPLRLTRWSRGSLSAPC